MMLRPDDRSKLLLSVVGGALMASAAGCHAPKRPSEWTPKSRVEWKDITAQPVPQLTDSFQILTTQPTTGLFPANMSVTRVSLEAGEEQGSPCRPRLYADPRNEFLQWNTVFDDQMALSEVFPIDQRDLGGGEADPVQIVAAFRALHARIGLIYAVNELSDTESEMFGVLYDNDAAQPIAAVHARAVSIGPPRDTGGRARPLDLWDTDSRALVRSRFAKLVHACVRELIQRDRPAVVESPAGWTPAGPVRPVEWPPRTRRPPR